MEFSGGDYWRGGIERLEEAQKVYEARIGDVLVIYLAGRAAECFFRALIRKKVNELHTGHSLKALFLASGLADLEFEHIHQRNVADSERDEIEVELSTAIADLSFVWQNDLRYASRSKALRHVLKNEKYRRLKGDHLRPLREAAKIALKAAQLVLQRGNILWTS